MSLVYDSYNDAFTEDVGAVRGTFAHEAAGNGVKVFMFAHGENAGGVRGAEISPTLDKPATRFAIGHTRDHEKGEGSEYHLKAELGVIKSVRRENQQDYILEATKIRRLTEIECERLQGFPDGWTKCEGVSKTQRYRLIGNAVMVPVVSYIATHLKRALTQEQTRLLCGSLRA